MEDISNFLYQSWFVDLPIEKKTVGFESPILFCLQDHVSRKIQIAYDINYDPDIMVIKKGIVQRSWAVIWRRDENISLDIGLFQVSVLENVIETIMTNDDQFKDLEYKEARRKTYLLRGGNVFTLKSFYDTFLMQKSSETN